MKELSKGRPNRYRASVRILARRVLRTLIPSILMTQMQSSTACLAYVQHRFFINEYWERACAYCSGKI